MGAFFKAPPLAREETENGDGDGEEDDEASGQSGRYHRKRGRPLAIRCYACAGSGKLEIADLRPEGGLRNARPVRCIACHGTGRVPVR
jgi:hypothetical protein